jgi:hypothetical protein
MHPRELKSTLVVYLMKISADGAMLTVLLQQLRM